MLAASSARDAFPAPGLAFTTTSTGGSSCWVSRKRSRTTRFTRFRFTAQPAARIPTAIPSRARPTSLGFAITVNNASDTRRPSRWTRSNCGLSV